MQRAHALFMLQPAQTTAQVRCTSQYHRHNMPTLLANSILLLRRRCVVGLLLGGRRTIWLLNGGSSVGLLSGRCVVLLSWLSCICARLLLLLVGYGGCGILCPPDPLLPNCAYNSNNNDKDDYEGNDSTEHNGCCNRGGNPRAAV